MIKIVTDVSLETLSPFKDEYLQQATAPLDGMWLCGFVPIAEHFGIASGSDLVGFFCVNADGYLLQFHLCQELHSEATEIFGALANNRLEDAPEIQGAFTSTAEPLMLSYCADAFSRLDVNALMYRFAGATSRSPSLETAELSRVEANQLELAVRFANENIGAPEDWLRGYFENLIARRELFGYWQEGALAATGERRLFDDVQTEYADLGVIVATNCRRQGLATMVLQWLAALAESRQLKPTCSTEMTNLGAQKAIRRAGFVATNRILRFHRPRDTGSQ